VSTRTPSVLTSPVIYELFCVLGHGAHGRVYGARRWQGDLLLGLAALKILHEAACLPHEVAAQAPGRLAFEARVMGRLQHAAVPGVLDWIDLGDGRMALATQWLPGVDLQAVLDARGRVPLRVALALVVSICELLAAAWRTARVIHRDIKPANLFLGPNGAVHVLDFGIATAEILGKTVETGLLVPGSWCYMAPERLDGQDGPTGDVYSLGLVFHQLTTGCLPRASHREAPEHERYVQALGGQIAAVVGECGEAVPDELLELFRGMMRLSPDERLRPEEVVAQGQRVLDCMDGPSLERWAADLIPDLMPKTFEAYPRVVSDARVPVRVPNPFLEPSAGELPPPLPPSVVEVLEPTCTGREPGLVRGWRPPWRPVGWTVLAGGAVCLITVVTPFRALGQTLANWLHAAERWASETSQEVIRSAPGIRLQAPESTPSVAPLAPDEAAVRTGAPATNPPSEAGHDANPPPSPEAPVEADPGAGRTPDPPPAPGSRPRAPRRPTSASGHASRPIASAPRTEPVEPAPAPVSIPARVLAPRPPTCRITNETPGDPPPSLTVMLVRGPQVRGHTRPLGEGTMEVPCGSDLTISWGRTGYHRIEDIEIDWACRVDPGTEDLWCWERG